MSHVDRPSEPPQPCSLQALGLRWVLGGLFASLLTGCSLLEFGYRHLNIWVGWKADHYLDLDAGQRRAMLNELAALQDWQVQHQVPAALALIADLRGHVARQDVSQDALYQAYLRALSLVRQLGQHAAPKLAQLSLQLNAEQLEHLDRALKRDQAEARERWIDASPKERTRDRTQRFIKNLSHWTGDLRADQVRIIEAHIQQSALTGDALMTERMRRHKQLLETLRAPVNQREDRLRSWLSRWEDGQTASYQAMTQQGRDQLLSTLAKLAGTLDDAQRAHVLKKLDELRTQISRLKAG